MDASIGLREFNSGGANIGLWRAVPAAGSLASPVCGRGRAEGAGEGSLLLGIPDAETALSRKRERERTVFVAPVALNH